MGLFFWRRNRANDPPTEWKSWVPGDSLIMRWVSDDQRERIYAVRRPDGIFSFRSEYYSDDKHERCWVPVDMGGSFYNSLETTLVEIHSQFPWTKDTEPEYPQGHIEDAENNNG